MTWLRQHGGWMLFAAVIGLAWLSVTTETFDEADSADATSAALAHIVASLRPGDAVVIKPMWDDGLHARLSAALMKRGLPVDGLAGGERIDPIHLLRFDRAWVLSRMHAGRGLPGIAETDASLDDSLEFGAGVRLELYDLAQARHLRRLTDDMPELAVSRRLKGGKVMACSWRGGRHGCGARSWLDVRRESRDVFHRDVAWLFAHAGPDKATLEIEWKGVPRSKLLLVRAGFTQASTRNQGGTPTSVRTLIDGSLRDEFVLQPYEYTLATRPIEPPAGGATMDVTFQIWCDDASWRQLMLQADLFNALLPSLARWAPPRDDTP